MPADPSLNEPSDPSSGAELGTSVDRRFGVRTPALALAAAVLVVEGVAAVAYGVFEATQIDSRRPVVGIGAAVLLVGYGVVLGLLGRGLRQVRRWSRGPVVATQLIQLPVAWGFREGNTWPVTALLGAASLVVLICVFLPSSTAALVGDSPVPVGSDDAPPAPEPETPITPTTPPRPGPAGSGGKNYRKRVRRRGR